jgi:hypothetical protein
MTSYLDEDSDILAHLAPYLELEDHFELSQLEHVSQSWSRETLELKFKRLASLVVGLQARDRNIEFIDEDEEEENGDPLPTQTEFNNAVAESLNSISDVMTSNQEIIEALVNNVNLLLTLEAERQKKPWWSKALFSNSK